MKKFLVPSALALSFALLFAACAPAVRNQLDPASTTYRLRDKLFNANETVIIQNDQGLNVYQVEPPVISLGDSLIVNNVQGQRLGRIDRRILSLNPTYILSKNGQRAAEISRDVLNAVFQGVTGTNTGDSYNVELADGSAPYVVRGDIFDLNYNVSRNGTVVADIYKPPFSLDNRYFVEIIPGQDTVLILEMVIALNELTQN